MVKVLNKVVKAKVGKGYKTLAFNAGALIGPGLLGVAGDLLNVPEIQGIIPPHYIPIYLAGVGVANVLLRLVTNTPVGKKY